MVTLINTILSGFNNNKKTLGIFLDFSKAFDTVNHKILGKKLEKYGIRGVANSLLMNYLSERKQYVFYNGMSSNMESINCGVPQGSILGPLLFLFYINDIDLISKNTFIVLFADDSNIFIQGKNLENMATILNGELIKFKDWLNANRLSLNIDKTHFMIFRPKKTRIHTDISISIDNKAISRIESIKFLGIFIDSNLSWEAHSKNIRSKIAKGIGIIKRTRNILSASTLRTLYFSFIYPYLTYGIEAWGSMINSYILPIIKLQKKIIRIISFANYIAHTAPLFSKLKILQLDKIYQFQLCMFMFKVYHKISPNIVKDMFEQMDNQYSTRSSGKFRVPLFHYTYLQRSLNFKGVVCWNYIADFVDYTCSAATYKKRLKIYLLANDIQIT